FESSDAERRALELHLFFVQGMRRVVSRDGIHGPISECYHDRLPVRVRPQWRIHFEIRIKLPDILVDEREVMRRNLARDRCLIALATAYCLKRVCGGKMSDVQMSPRSCG